MMKLSERIKELEREMEEREGVEKKGGEDLRKMKEEFKEKYGMEYDEFMGMDLNDVLKMYGF